jgi:hypothetical protein
MKTLLIDILLIFTAPLMLMAQEIDGRRWMAGIDDTRTVASLSIPGAHDAATGEGLIMAPGLGKTQELTLAELWDCGVRAFDLRPAVKGEELHIYHGPVRTKVSFCKALEILCDKLTEHPTEFAIVLMREENDSENSTERVLWPTAVGKAIENTGDKAAIFSPAMKVGDARGKIIFISRNAYTGCNRGAIIEGWNHSPQGTANARITSLTDDATARLQMQDYYAPTDKEKQKAKEEAVLQCLQRAASAPADVWTINFASGYRNCWLGFTPFATTSGYKRNAERIHPIIINSLTTKPQPTGIMMLDFAGCDKTGGGIWHWGCFETLGTELVNKIIGQNFK